jgi:hypothetical protein
MGWKHRGVQELPAKEDGVDGPSLSATTLAETSFFDRFFSLLTMALRWLFDENRFCIQWWDANE